MRYYAAIIALAAGTAACNGANNTNLNPNTAPNVNVRNVNVIHPEASPQNTMTPAAMPANMMNGNATHQGNRMPPPGMANEKMTPGRMPPGMLGTPVKKPTP
jgi:hypothetical protein